MAHPNNRFRKRIIVTGTGQADLVVPPTLGGFDQRMLFIATAVTGAGTVALVVQAAIPLWVAQAGNLSIGTNAGGWVTVAYTSWTGSTFTIASTDFTLTPAAIGNRVAVTMSQRATLTGWQIIGHNTNAAATTFTVRNKTTTANVLFGGSMLPTTGNIQLSTTGVEVPGTAGETIELNVAGAITGQIDIMAEGFFTPSDHPSSISYI